MAAATASKTIGILTSGGDCSGLNAAIRAVTVAADLRGWRVYGILESTDGLLRRPVAAVPLTPSDVSGVILRTGGTMLGTVNKSTHNPYRYPQADGSFRDITPDIAEGYRMLGLDALVVIGGDGSFGLLGKMGEIHGMNIVGIPKTIDNDIGATEVAIGFDTAVSVATEALDRLQPTAASHQRVMILEVMGRDAGHIALRAGIAGGADVILIPEIAYDFAKITQKISAMRQAGHNHALVVVSEAVKGIDGQALRQHFADGQTRHGGIGHHLGHEIAKATGADTRVTVLGHLQRGGVPTATDRLIASAFGAAAVNLIAQGKFNRMVAWQNQHVVDVPISEAIKENKKVEADDAMLLAARALGICLGD
jgi:6-phosphofructokinase 1